MMRVQQELDETKIVLVRRPTETSPHPDAVAMPRLPADTAVSSSAVHSTRPSTLC